MLVGNWLDSWPPDLCQKKLFAQRRQSNFFFYSLFYLYGLHSGFSHNGIVNTAITGICQDHILVFPYWYSAPHLARAFLSHCHWHSELILWNLSGTDSLYSVQKNRVAILMFYKKLLYWGQDITQRRWVISAVYIQENNSQSRTLGREI